tara:strand:+ start:215 stop:415 length:201 start_codon:yes stop_codon:yes gene_type:complete
VGVETETFGFGAEAAALEEVIHLRERVATVHDDRVEVGQEDPVLGPVEVGLLDSYDPVPRLATQPG